MSFQIRQRSRTHHRPSTMAWLAAQFISPDFHDTTHAGRTALIAWVEHRCRTMRAQGLAGAWHYDLPLHTELLRILAAEKAELAGDRDPGRLPPMPAGGNSGPPSARNEATPLGDSSTERGLTSTTE
jgi:hypothetical protein